MEFAGPAEADEVVLGRVGHRSTEAQASIEILPPYAPSTGKAEAGMNPAKKVKAGGSV